MIVPIPIFKCGNPICMEPTPSNLHVIANLLIIFSLIMFGNSFVVIKVKIGNVQEMAQSDRSALIIANSFVVIKVKIGNVQEMAQSDQKEAL